MSWRLFARSSLLLSVAVAAAIPFGHGCAPCEPEPEPEPFYRIVGNRADWVPGSGRVQVTDTHILISYKTKDGSAWEVEYLRVNDP